MEHGVGGRGKQGRSVIADLKLEAELVKFGYETCGMDRGVFDTDFDGLGDLGWALGRVVGCANGGGCLAGLWDIGGPSRLRVVVARSCVAGTGDSGDVGLGLFVWHAAGRLVGLCWIVFGGDVWLWLREAFHGARGGAISGGKRLPARKNDGGTRWWMGDRPFARRADFAGSIGGDGGDVAHADHGFCHGLGLWELANGSTLLMDRRDGA